MKLFIKILLLAIIDFIVIWFWVKENDPDPSVSIAIIVVVPAAILINLIIALVLYFTKRELSKLFVINSIISGILMYWLFLNGIDKHQKLRYESWKFEIKDTIFEITHYKLDGTFYVSESTIPGSSFGGLGGKFSRKGNEIQLIGKSKKYIIRNGYIYGFRSSNDSIKVKKVD